MVFDSERFATGTASPAKATPATAVGTNSKLLFLFLQMLEPVSQMVFDSERFATGTASLAKATPATALGTNSKLLF